MKTLSTLRRTVLVATAALLVGVITSPTAGAQSPTTVETGPCLPRASTVSAVILVDNPVEVDPVAPALRQELVAVIAADLVGLATPDRTVEVAVGRMGREFSLRSDWTALDASTFTATVDAVGSVPPTAESSLAASIEGAQQELLDRVGDDGCGLVIGVPVGPVAFDADEASELCASGGTIDSLRSLPAHVGLVTTPNAIADVDRALLDAVAGAPGSQESCGSVSAAGAVIDGATRAELLTPVGRFIDDLASASVTTDETGVCQVFVCPEGSTSIDATAGTQALGFEGAFPMFGYDVIVEAPNGDKTTLPAGANRTVELSDSTLTVFWPSPATISISVSGESLEGRWTATVVDTAAAGPATAEWQRSVVAAVEPRIISITPTDAGSEATVQVDLFSAAGERLDANTLPALVPEGVIVDTVTGSSTKIEFGPIIEGSYLGTVTLPDDLGPEADIVVSLPSGEPATSTFSVTTGTTVTPPPVTGSESEADGFFSMSRLAIVGLAVVGVIVAVWLLRRRGSTERADVDLRSGSFDIVIGPDNHISRVVDGKAHPLFLWGPDFSPLPPGSGRDLRVEELELRPHRDWNPLSTGRRHARSTAGPVVGSDGRKESGDALSGVVPAQLSHSWAFVLDVEATAHANQSDTASAGVVRGQLHVFIDESLTSSNEWLTRMVEELPEAARWSFQWARSKGLTDVRLGGPPAAGTYAEFANLVTD